MSGQGDPLCWRTGAQPTKVLLSQVQMCTIDAIECYNAIIA